MIDATIDAIGRMAALGGPVVLILMAVSVLTMAVILYKIWQFRAAGVGRHAALRAAIESWDAGRISDAHASLGQSTSYLKPVVALGLHHRADTARMEAEAETLFLRLERGFKLLDTVAQLAPLLGLFGTVLGMISAFQALQEAGAQVDPSILAGGIWVALLTTAAGLIVAMPTAAVLTWFEARMDAERVFAGRAIATISGPTSHSQTQTDEVLDATFVPA
ncbi:MotA/TolQ/ExbB proton channel family protein [Marivita sp. S0852]|uniref:MotA/TolQ/ExbB proton channel family protein n=1 Tax=Marivita sp. S0852 TaxID=3373893 RepID=UPI003981D666